METNTPKRETRVMVYGHSWVEFFKRFERMFPNENWKTDFCCVPGVGIEEMVGNVSSVIKPEHTHLLLFVLLTEAYKQQYLRPQEKEFPVIVPNFDFKLSTTARKLGEFVKKCKEINPEIEVIVVREPALDINYFNFLQVRKYSAEIQDEYESNSKFKPHRLHEENLKQFEFLSKLTKLDYMWPQKKLFSCQGLLELPDEDTVCKFMNNRLQSLLDKGPLSDGIHPTETLIKEMWNALMKNGYITCGEEMELLDCPDMDKLDVSEKKSNGSTAAEINWLDEVKEREVEVSVLVGVTRSHVYDAAAQTLIERLQAEAPSMVTSQQIEDLVLQTIINRRNDI